MRVVAFLMVLVAFSGCGPAAAEAGDTDVVSSGSQSLGEASQEGAGTQRGEKSAVMSQTSASRPGGTVALPQDPIPWRVTVINGTVTIEFDLPTDRVR